MEFFFVRVLSQQPAALALCLPQRAWLSLRRVCRMLKECIDNKRHLWVNMSPEPCKLKTFNQFMYLRQLRFLSNGIKKVEDFLNNMPPKACTSKDCPHHARYLEHGLPERYGVATLKEVYVLDMEEARQQLKRFRDEVQVVCCRKKSSI